LFLKENAEYRKKLTEIETQLNLVQFVLDFVVDDKHSNQLIPANLGITDPALIMLITEYNELMLRKMRVERSASGDNPVLNQMHSQLSLMRENVIATMISVRETLMIAKNDLEKLFYIADVWRDDAPAQIKQYREVVRMKLMKEKLYLFLYQKREENALSLVAAIPPAKIIAVPQMNPIPLSPKWKYYALICLFLGMGFPLGIMILGDMFNNRISMNSKDLEKNLKVKLAGVIANNKGESVVIREGDHSVAAEMFRTLRTNIRLAQPTGLKSPVVLVTSNVNDEGKSHVAINLAISMAMLGKKVALLEMDFRKPSLAKYLNLSSQGSLTDYLSNKVYMLEDVIVDSSIKNLDVLPVSVAPSNPSELLQSDRTETLFADLRERYDYVVVDSAPVSMVSDTFLLGGTADMTVFVVRADYTTFEMIDSINKIYEQERLPNMLAVLNGVNAKELDCGF
jgi:capsular exopolysaccharide synthesis family protein